MTLALWIEAASWVLLVLGSAFCLIGGVGVLRLPDVYARTHGAAITDTLGAALVLAGLMLQAGPTMIAVKLLLVLAFMLFTGPAASHALVKAAYAHNVRAYVDPKDSDAPPTGGDAGT